MLRNTLEIFQSWNWLARLIASVSTFNIRFTAFFIAVPATRAHLVEVLVASPLFRRTLSCPHYSEVGMAGWDLSLLIQYRYLPYHLPYSPRHLSFPSFRALSFSRLAINGHRSGTQVHAMTTCAACTCVKIFANSTWSILNVSAWKLTITEFLKETILHE